MESFYWVIPDILAGMSAPQRTDIANLLNRGIKAVVSLLDDDTNMRKGDSYDFLKYEFSGSFSIDKLYAAIKASHFEPIPEASDHMIESLNELLKIPDFYDNVVRKGMHTYFSDRINELVSLSEEYRTQIYTNLGSYGKNIIKKLNRLLLESLYPSIIPSSVKIEHLYKNVGIDFVHFPITPMCPPTKEQIDAFRRYTEMMISKGNPVAVHCQYGRGRTGTMLTAYLIHLGNDFDGAFEKIRKVNPGAIESISQLSFLKNLKRS